MHFKKKNKKKQKKEKSSVFQKNIKNFEDKIYDINGDCGNLTSKSEISCDFFYYKSENIVTFTIYIVTFTRIK